MLESNQEKWLKSILKLDIFQEIIYTISGCLLIFLLFLLTPRRYHFLAKRSKDFPLLFLSILFLSFLFIFILINQTNAKNRLFKLNYKRNIILFSIFNYAAHCFLFFYTKFGIYFFKINFSGSFVYESFFVGRPFYIFIYLFLIFYTILPILLYEVWKKVYKENLAFFITILSTAFILNPFYIDLVIGILFIVPFILYYLENIKNKIFKRKDYIYAGIFGSILFCCYCIYFLIIPIYLIISLFLNKKDIKENFKQKIIIFLLILLFSCWLWIPLLISFFIIGQNISLATNIQLILIEFQLFNLSFLFSYLGAFFIISLIIIIKNYKKSRDIQILGNLMLSSFILLFITFIGLILELFFIPIYYFRIHFYVSIIVSCIFYVRLFHFFKKGKIFGDYQFKGNFKQLEIYLLILITFSQIYFNAHNVYSSEYHRHALNQDDPDDVILDYLNEQDRDYELPIEDIYELSLLNSYILYFYIGKVFLHFQCYRIN